MKAALLSLFDSIYKLLILKAGEETRNNYLRRKGVKIGKNCKVHTVSFSTEPYLVEIGDNVRITSGTTSSPMMEQYLYSTVILEVASSVKLK